MILWSTMSRLRALSIYWVYVVISLYAFYFVVFSLIFFSFSLFHWNVYFCHLLHAVSGRKSAWHHSTQVQWRPHTDEEHSYTFWFLCVQKKTNILLFKLIYSKELTHTSFLYHWFIMLILAVWVNFPIFISRNCVRLGCWCNRKSGLAAVDRIM